MFTCTNPNLITLYYDGKNNLLSRQFVNLKKHHFSSFYSSDIETVFDGDTKLNNLLSLNKKNKIKYSIFENHSLLFEYSRFNSEGSLISFDSYTHFSGQDAFPVDKYDKRCKLPSHRVSSKIYRVPCGGCLSCRLQKATEWSVRCSHQYSTSNQVGCFLTLTYSDENLPEGGVLVRRHIQLFMKRLRKHLYGNSGGPLKYFCCGEYGDKNLRPHYHLIIFGYDFPEGRDRLENYQKSSSSKFKLRIKNKLLDRLWTYGHYSIGELSYESAKYVASYSLKKSIGHQTEVNGVKEFIGCSQGLGKDWLLKNINDVYKNDYVVVKTSKSTFKMRPPRYYDRLLKKYDKENFDIVIKKRLSFVKGDKDIIEFSSDDYLKLEGLDQNLKSSAKRRL